MSKSKRRPPGSPAGARDTAERLQEQLRCLKRLNELNLTLQKEVFSLPNILQLIVETATQLTGAQYGALGVFDEAEERLTQLITTGMDEAVQKAIGALPTGRGLLGFLAKEGGVLRLADLMRHPAFSGFPPNHPPMNSFLGVSIKARGKTFGRIYLTNKQSPGQAIAEFTELDEQTVGALAITAGADIENSILVNEIRQSEERYRRIVDTAQEGIWVLDAEAKTSYVNQPMAAMLGYSVQEMQGRPLYDFMDSVAAVEAEANFERRKQGVKETHDFRFRKKDGSNLWTIVCTSPMLNEKGEFIGALGMIVDITERKRLEEQLRQAAKMEAIGRLAGGVAHDFNNLLSIVQSSCQFLLSDLDRRSPSYQDAEEIQKAAERAATLTRQLLAFSRKQVLAPRVLDLNATVANLDRMLRRLIGEDIILETVLGSNLGRVFADPAQIEQVMMNLAINARDAMPKGGRLVIETANGDLDEEYRRLHAPVVPGPYVMLAVSDTGIGMDSETQGRIFEPFFTTKEMGKGTGLGLATVYGIVKQSGGYIWVYSEPGYGTTFKIYLPRTEEAAETHAESAAQAKPLEGSETILVVEDDQNVRSLARKILERYGYTVLDARDPEDALEICRRHAGSIHLTVTDVVMPKMSGPELAEALHAIRPDLKILYMSGYAGAAIIKNGVLKPGTAFLQKPITPDTLARKVREVLDSSRS